MTVDTPIDPPLIKSQLENAHMHARRIIFVLAILTLAGCAAPPKKQAFNRAASGALKVVAIAQQPNQDQYEAAIVGHPAAGFGLIGGLVAAADTASKSTRLTHAIGPDETRLQERFTSEVTHALKANGYEITTIALSPDDDDAKAIGAARANGQVDAVLRSRIIGAYLSAGPTTQYLPQVQAQVRLLDAKTGYTLFEDTFSYGFSFGNMPTVHFEADQRYRFDTIDTLVADPNMTRQGLIDGATVIASQIATDLRHD